MERTTSRYTFFFRPESPFSQWYPAEFTVDAAAFVCAEQFMMHGKALLFGDAEIAAEILAVTAPRSQGAWPQGPRLRRGDLARAARGHRLRRQPREVHAEPRAAPRAPGHGHHRARRGQPLRPHLGRRDVDDRCPYRRSAELARQEPARAHPHAAARRAR